MTVNGVDVVLERQDDDAVVIVSGALDSATLPLLRAALVEACGREASTDVVVDFANVTFCGAETLGLLTATAGRLRASGGRLVVCNLPPRHLRMFRLSGLEHLLRGEAKRCPEAGTARHGSGDLTTVSEAHEQSRRLIADG